MAPPARSVPFHSFQNFSALSHAAGPQCSEALVGGVLESPFQCGQPHLLKFLTMPAQCLDILEFILIHEVLEFLVQAFSTLSPIPYAISCCCPMQSSYRRGHPWWSRYTTRWAS
jgi:hypothetical protein